MMPDMPEFLRRVDTEASRKRRARIVAEARKIKNPPKRAKRSTKLLGQVFGAKLRSW